ncbi:MAG TPA: ATP-dependent sacrificial sulfur transferase LarE [Methanothermococcus okinawensis]|nr:ATP-dependent sacrificial sulfur transferase LarE [Methanothermococcus okinawensis]
MLMEKLRELKYYFREKICVVSYSGGMDSLLVTLMSKYCGRYTLAVTVDNGFFPEENIRKSTELSKRYGIDHKVVNLNYLKNEVICEINRNLKNRCYICKRYMAEILVKERDELRNTFNKEVVIVDGTNYDDLFEDRPGIMAYREYGIRSPLAELEIRKEEVKEILKYLGVSIPKEDSCLATRILNPPITEERLKMVYKAEKFLASYLGLEGYFRVRDLHGTAIIEINCGEVHKIMDTSKFRDIGKKFREIGFNRCVLRMDSI